MTLPTRLADKIDASGDCWEWTGHISKGGYGQAWHEGRDSTAHRIIYSILVGDIGPLQIDHLCRNRSCVNPDHLQPVTQIENVRRGVNHNRNKGHCPKGHAYSDNNVRVRTSSDGYTRRHCFTCQQGWDSRENVTGRNMRTDEGVDEVDSEKPSGISDSR